METIDHVINMLEENKFKEIIPEEKQEAIEVLEEQKIDHSKCRYFSSSVSRGKSKGHYYPRLVFQKDLLEKIGFDYKTPLKVRVDLEEETVTFYKA